MTLETQDNDGEAPPAGTELAESFDDMPGGLKLGAARGIVWGVLLGAVAWAVIILAVRMMLKY